MDNRKPPTATATSKQTQLVRELCLRYGFNIPSTRLKNIEFVIRFLKLFAYDPKLDIDDQQQRGWKVINIIRNAYRYDIPAYETAHKLDVQLKDVNFVVDILKNHCSKPLFKENIDQDLEQLAFEEEEKLAYPD